MNRKIVAFLAVIAVLMLAGCYGGRKSGKGLYLPEGSIEKGQAAFLALNCNQCHRVEGVQLPAPTLVVATNIVLGGKVSRIQTHGELVTAIINPSHGLAPRFNKELAPEGKISPMPRLNDRMTVAQLIDLVTFVQSRYEIVERDYSLYGK